MKADRQACLIDRALDEIQPAADQREACRQKIATCMGLLQDLHAQMKGLPSPAKLRESYDRVAQAAERTINAMRELHPMQRRHLEDFLAQLEAGAKRAKNFAAATVVPSGSQVWNDVKGVAALFARDILKEHGRIPTCTEGGAFYALACILYEGATGKAEQDLSQYCRNVGKFAQRYRMKGPD
jgi:hypothetical protein